MSEVNNKESLLSRIIDGAMDAIKKPFVVKRVTRAFDSAKDSIEEQIMDKEAGLNNARESLVEAAKTKENLKDYIQTIIDLKSQIKELKQAQEVLRAEKEELL